MKAMIEGPRKRAYDRCLDRSCAIGDHVAWNCMIGGWQSAGRTKCRSHIRNHRMKERYDAV